MPTVAMERQFRFVVNTRENGFESPHVHVWVGNEDVCRIELNRGPKCTIPRPATFGTYCVGKVQNLFEQLGIGRRS